MNDETQALAKQCETFLESVSGLAICLLDTLRFDRQNPQQLYAVCLFSRLLELASGCKVMIEKDALMGIPVLLRSMFEADVDLTNIMKYPDYPKQMYASFLKEKLRLEKEAASSSTNPFLTDIRKHRNPKDDLAQTQSELDELIEEGNGPISIRCRAMRAGRLDEYLSVYNMLCLDTHNNIRSLEDWNIEITSEDEYRVVAFKMTKADLLHHLSAIPSILLVQSKALADFLGTTGIKFEPYFEKLKSIQTNIKEHVQKDANKSIQADRG